MNRKRAFYYDPSRNRYILLARRRLNQAQALPNAPKFATPLDPASCTGKWFIPSSDITEKLQELEKVMHRAWRRVERDKKSTPDSVTNKAAYLRRVFDHFLYDLHRRARQKGGGTFKSPIPLNRIEEPNMLNALQNLAAGRAYSVGALKYVPQEPNQPVQVKREPSESQRSSSSPAPNAQDEGSLESNNASPNPSGQNSDIAQESTQSQESEISVEYGNRNAYVVGPRDYSRGKRRQGGSAGRDEIAFIKRMLGPVINLEDTAQESRQSQESESSVQSDNRKAYVAGPRGYSRGKRQRGDSVEIDEKPFIKRKRGPPLDPEDSEEEEPDLLLQTNRGAQERRTSVDNEQDQQHVEMVERTLVGVGVQTDSLDGPEGMAILQQDSMPRPAALSPDPQAFRSAAPEQEHLALMWSATYPMLRAVMQDMPITSEDLRPNPKKAMRLRFWEAQRGEALALLERMDETFLAVGSGSASTPATPQCHTFAPIRFEKT